MFYRKYGKKIIDLIFAFLFFLLLSPIFIIVAILIKLDSEGPIIFKHKRIGKDCKVINVFKFRTMIKNAIFMGPEYTRDNDSRITKIGKILRKTSLDELPQLWNIFHGDMSLIGPRPDAYTENPTDFQRKRTKILPGITGLAQVKGRSNLTEQKREEYDLEYVKKYSFLFDLKIFFQTIKVIILKQGSN